MSSPSLARRADTSRSETQVTSEVRTISESGTASARQPGVLVISVHADERGASEAARWAEQVGGAGASAVVSSDALLEKRVDAARRVLVLDPGMMAAWRGFGARATSKERLQLVSRLATRFDHVTWVSSAPQAAQWIRSGQE
jgi:hypothetical protein